MRFIDNVRGGDQYVVAELPINRATHAITKQSVCHRCALNFLMNLQLRVKGSLTLSIVNQLNADKQATTTNVADIRVFAQHRTKTCPNRMATRQDILEQFLIFDYRERGVCCCNGRYMPHECVAMLKKTTAIPDRVGYFAPAE